MIKKRINFHCGCIGDINTWTFAPGKIITSVKVIEPNCDKHHHTGRTADDQMVAEIEHLRATIETSASTIFSAVAAYEELERKILALGYDFGPDGELMGVV